MDKKQKMASPHKKFNFNAPLDDLNYQERLFYASTGLIQKAEDLNPSFNQDDIARFVSVAKEEALREAKSSIDIKCIDVLNKMIVSLNSLLEQQQTLEDHFYHIALGFIAAFSQKIFPNLARRHAFDELDLDLKEKVSTILQKPKLSITLHPEVLSVLEPKINENLTCHGFEGRVICRSDSSFALLDYQIHWEEGGIEKNIQRLMAELDKIAMPFLEKLDQESKIENRSKE